jgi:4-amino-4-deoxy-L-arabinose transferase-like glycosyltransferase
MVVAAFLIRFGLFLYIRTHAPQSTMENYPIGAETGRLAKALAAGEGFSSPLSIDTGPSAWMTPLYPLLLAGVFKVYGTFSWLSFLVVAAINCALSSLTAWPVYAIGRKAFGTAVGVTAGWLWAFLLTAIFYSVVWVWDTSLSALIFSLIILATLHICGTKRAAAWAGYGALWGAGALTNASMISTLPFLAGWAAMQLRQKSLPWLRPVAVTLFVFTVAISPWFIRNYVVFHRIILFRDNFGLELWLGNNPSNPGIWSWWLHPNDDDGEREIFARMGELPYMELKQREAISWIKAHPRDFLEDTWHRFIDNWTGFDDPISDRLRGRLYTKVLDSLGLFFPLLTFAGALLAYRQRSPYAFPLAAVLLVFPLIYYVTHTSMRYRHPIEPVMTVLAAVTVARMGSMFAGRPAGQLEEKAEAAREMMPAD